MDLLQNIFSTPDFHSSKESLQPFLSILQEKDRSEARGSQASGNNIEHKKPNIRRIMCYHIYCLVKLSGEPNRGCCRRQNVKKQIAYSSQLDKLPGRATYSSNSSSLNKQAFILAHSTSRLDSFTPPAIKLTPHKLYYLFLHLNNKKIKNGDWRESSN